ncbi:MAG: hypothetical protein QGG73_05370 [Candidatus Hydrogenedentes bacterium]|nr:hypothetical protein [Candidatus Hydrogenedentota bacterium]
MISARVNIGVHGYPTKFANHYLAPILGALAPIFIKALRYRKTFFLHCRAFGFRIIEQVNLVCNFHNPLVKAPSVELKGIDHFLLALGGNHKPQDRGMLVNLWQLKQSSPNILLFHRLPFEHLELRSKRFVYLLLKVLRIVNKCSESAILVIGQCRIERYGIMIALDILKEDQDQFLRSQSPLVLFFDY